MTKAHDFLTLINEQQTTQANQIKQLLSSVTDDDVIICFSDLSYLIVSKDSLSVECCIDDLPFLPVDVDLIDLTKD